MGIALLFFWSFVGLLTLASFALNWVVLSLTRARHHDQSSPQAVDDLKRTARYSSALGLVCFFAYVYFIGRWSGFFLGLGLLPLAAQQVALASAWQARPGDPSGLSGDDVGFNRL
ncbi:MAG: hypothetical protein J0I12_13680 [Candidatus Eremiobacteraeota bacterium]|nr:hypothetical protein [Candidatus Eremiobacteraeota bacterium]